MNKKINLVLFYVFLLGLVFLTGCATTPDSAYTVTFDSQGGSTVNSQIMEYGQMVSEPAEPTRESYVFEGWYQESACINLWDFATDTVTSNLTLYAKWTSLLVRYVSIIGDDSNDGSMDHPWKSIQYALAYTPDGGTVYVADGIYKEFLIFPSDRVIVLKSENGATFTTIDAGNSHRVIEMDSCPDGTVLDDFTITGGNNFEKGGGISVFNCSPTISNNTITGNQVKNFGGGAIYLFYSSATISNNTISGNTANKTNESDSGNGGAIYMQYSTPTISNNTITGNQADRGGGGIYLSYSSPTIEDNTISGNIAAASGGICMRDHCSPTISNNTISGNTAGSYGGAIYLFYSSATISNNTITGNQADGYGGGIYNYCSSSTIPTIQSNTISENICSGQGGGIFMELTSPSIIIGGADASDTANFNTVCGNSPDQIEPNSYPNNNIYDVCP